MSQPQPLPDLGKLYGAIQQAGKKNPDISKFKLLQIAKAAKNDREVNGLVVSAQVHLYFNEFEDAENNLLLAKKKYPNDTLVWHMFFSLYLLWGKWRKLRSVILEMYDTTNISFGKEDSRFLDIIMSYPIIFYDLDLLEIIMSKHQIEDTKNGLADTKYIVDSVNGLDIDMDAVRDIISLGHYVYSQKFHGIVQTEIVTGDEVNILLFVDVSDVGDLMELNSNLIKKKLELSSKSEFNKKYNNYISATFLPSNNNQVLS